jgi:transposase
MLLLESGKDSRGQQVRRGHSSFSLMRCACGCGEEFVYSPRQHSSTIYKAAGHKTKHKRTLVCDWCGIHYITKKNPSTVSRSHCCCQFHVGLLQSYGSIAKREALRSRFARLLLVEGLSRTKAQKQIGIAPTTAKKLCELTWGPGAWEYFRKRDGVHPNSGRKGRQKPKQLTIKEQMMIRGSEKRKETALAIRIWRQTNSTQQVGLKINGNENSGSGILLRSCVYRRMSRKRRDKSLWNRREVSHGYRKAEAIKESTICDKVQEALQAEGFRVHREHMVDDWSKVDIFATRGLWRFAIEVKASSRKSRIAGAIGQALISGTGLGAIPVACVPSCFTHHDLPTGVLERAGGLFLNDENIIDELYRHMGIKKA